MKQLAIAILVAVASTRAFADEPRTSNWPQFRNTGNTGISTEKNLARTWPKEGPPVLWSIPVSYGYACPVIDNGEVFLMERDSEKREDFLRVLSLDTGKELWRFTFSARRELRSYPGTRNTPLVDDKHVYVLGALGHFFCLDRKTHEVLWKIHLVDDFKADGGPGSEATLVPTWGFTGHPTLYKNWIILPPQTEKTGLIALDKDTGKIAWKSPAIGRNWFSYVAPYVTTLNDVDQIIAVANDHHGKNPPAVITGVDAATGVILWSIKTEKRYNVPIPQPVKIADDQLFFGGGYTVGIFTVKVTKDATGKWTPAIINASDNANPHLHAPILYKEHLYVQSFDRFHQVKQHGLVCLNLRGEQMWRTGPDRTFDNGGLLIADDLLFVVNGKTGELSLIEATPEKFNELAKAPILTAEEEMAWAELALADGKLLVRDLVTLKCLDVRAPKK